MNRSPAFRAALLSASVFLLPFAATRSFAAELVNDDDDDKPAQQGVIKNAGTRVPQPEIAPASDEAAQALNRMKVPDGLAISLWAAEPMLANPVAFNFDEKGRIFVAETYRYRTSVLDIRDYMWVLEDELASRTIEDRTAMIRKRFGPAGEKELSIETEVVRLLEDTNNDGVADKSYVYADGFNSALDGIASGVLARRGKVWLTNIPSVWQFTGDKKAETRTEVSRGYGVRFNYTGHDLHGLVWGPDGKIYFSNGDRGATVKTKEGKVIDTADEGAVYRMNPDGSQLEVFATGLRNPQSLAFNEFGDLLTGDNDSDQGDEERLVHVIEGSDNGWRVGYQFAPLGQAGPWNLEKLWHQRHPGQPAYIVPPIANIEDGPSGIEYYPGTGLNASYAGSIFITHFKGAIARSGIYTYTLKPKGASYEIADSKPFLTNALPTDVKFGPDGRLYISDWADGWPKSKRGRIYAIADKNHASDAAAKETKALIGGDWTKRSNEELAKLLAHADWRVRLEAQYELADRGAPSFATLANLATDKSASPLARRHAIWSIGQQSAKSQELLRPLRTLVTDADAEVRAQAIKVLGDARNGGRDEIGLFINALNDSSSRVKFFAAQGLGKLALTSKHPKAQPATPALLAALRANNNEDAALRHALVMGLVGLNDTAALKAALADSSPAVRLGAVLALRRLKSADLQIALNDADPYIAQEAAIAINDAPVEAAFPALAAKLGQGKLTDPVVLRAINAHFRLGQPANAAALANYAHDASAPAKLRAEAIAQLGLWPKPPARDRLVGIYRPVAQATRDRTVAVNALQPILNDLLASTAPAAVQTAALKALQDLEIAGATDALFAAVKNDQLSGPTRAAALNALDKIKDARLPDAVKFASESTVPALRLAALPLAARLSPDAAAPVLANLLAKGTTEEKKAAYRALGNLKHATADTLIAQHLRDLAAGKVPAAVQLELLAAAGAPARRDNPEIKQLLEQREATLASSTDPLAPYRVALAGGDRTRGERVFRNHPVMACIRCHRAGGDGGDAGPDLADIGRRQNREYLLEAVVKPNAKIAEGFDTVVLTLKNGNVAAGIIAQESADMISLRNTDNKVIDVKKSEIAKREGAPSSMPEIYGAILTKRELRDVVEYMANLRERPFRQNAAQQQQPRALRGFPPPPRAE
jgi:quinoprotein glucose dehydrogenase